MRINSEYSHDRRLLHRTGLAIERHTLRSYHESWPVVAWACGLTFVVIFIAGCLRLGGVL